jgi:predicted metal-binding protein
MYKGLIENIVYRGANKANIISVSEIPFEPELRKLCESNQCGNYGRSWTCPPNVGDVYQLMEKAKGYDYALVFQTVSGLEDSYDFEGMQLGLKHHEDVTNEIKELVYKEINPPILQLSAGWCKICQTCAKIEDKPCRYPDKAVASLESYGIFVARLAEKADMKYINGVNTVTYFGAFLFN